tara:strand:- start:471 stop:602 length:132 start_codon:yes stop_codon:yes gene_type:complete
VIQEPKSNFWAVLAWIWVIGVLVLYLRQFQGFVMPLINKILGN